MRLREPLDHPLLALLLLAWCVLHTLAQVAIHLHPALLQQPGTLGLVPHR